MNANPSLFQAQQTAAYILSQFNQFYLSFLEIPDQAKQAFENRNHAQSIELSSRRLQLYSRSVHHVIKDYLCDLSELATNELLWNEVEQVYRERIKDRYENDLALAYLHSVRRVFYKSEWRTEDYSILKKSDHSKLNRGEFINSYAVDGDLSAELIAKILIMQKFSVDYSNLQSDAIKILNRLAEKFEVQAGKTDSIHLIELFNAGFYRNRGAYLVGRLHYAKDKSRPFIIALLNDEQGIYVDAIITSTTFAHNMFSSTLANFHVTTRYYHELCIFLKSIMPMRPLGMHYSTVGYNHLGKVAVMNEMESEKNQHDEEFQTAVGMEGTVAMAFSTLHGSYCLKVIRNTPTQGYKWGVFEGIDSVLSKYRRVHDINRTDSMLDSVIYYNLRLDKNWFEQDLLMKLLEYANESVIDDNDSIIFKYLIVQRKLIPLPVYLESATDAQAEKAIINLGYCIKNNLAANIFNKDLDVRNYGITSYSKVYLFDYDALEKLTEVKVRTNLDRFDGEEDIPEWFFESGVILLPEEIIAGLCLPYRHLRSVFADKHNELLTMPYWQTIQQDLALGVVPSISVYPDSEKLI